MAETSLPDLLPQAHKALVEQRGPIQNANELREQSLSVADRIALAATSVVGTMWFFFGCLIMVTIPLLLPASMKVIQYISSGYLQLILLPLIMVGQNLQSRHTEIRAENDYQINLKAEAEVEHIFRHLEYQNAILIALMRKLDVKLEDVLTVSEETYTELEKLAELKLPPADPADLGNQDTPPQR
jgi:uncharacterized membrane protein